MNGRTVCRLGKGVNAWSLVFAVAVVLFGTPCLAQDRTAEVFKRRDKNGDGKLSREEVPNLAERMFNRIDANADGFISREEDAAFRRARGQQQRQQPQQAQQQRSRLPEPDHANVSYGPHERNVLDIWPAKSDKPTPLVIYYHGGGFRGGDKRSLNPQLLQRLLEGGVTVAAANYRLTDAAPFPAQMHDCARALQFLRHNAKKYNIDPTRVGATGGSAGAGISQWLAFHDDLADPKSDDPIARESTRLTCAVVYAAQTSYDPRFIHELFGTNQMHPALVPFYGLESEADVTNPKYFPLYEEASPINHLTKDDVPVMYFYPQANEPLAPNSTGQQHIHHPKFGEIIKKKFDALGIKCVLKYSEDYPGDARRNVVPDYAEFFLKHLYAKGSAE